MADRVGEWVIHVLQKLVGHATITTTREFYLSIGDASERGALDTMSKPLDE